MFIKSLFRLLRKVIRFKLLDNYISKKLSTKKDNYLEISTTVGCAMMCDYCPQDTHKVNGKDIPKRLTLDIFKKVIENIPVTTMIHWTGYSEALGNKNFPIFSDMLKEKGNYQLVNTTMHGHHECIEFMKKTKNFSKITFHLPDNRNLMKLKVNKEYIDNLNEVIRFQSKILNDKLYIIVFGDDFHEEVRKLIDELVNSKIIKKSQIEIRKHLHSRAGNITEKKLDGFYFSKNSKKKGDNNLYYCANNRLNQGVLIPDGRISLCCHDYSLSYFKGDLKSEKLTEIYENKDLFDKNSDFIKGKFHPCTSCEFYKTL